MKFARKRHDFSCAMHRVECNDRILTHLLLCEPRAGAIDAVRSPHLDTIHIEDDGPSLKRICEAIGRNTHLRDVCFDAPLGLNDTAARASPFDGLKRNRSIRSLRLSRCDLGRGVGRGVLGAFEENHRRLTKAKLWQCVVLSDGPSALAATLAKCTHLAEISLSSCRINDDVATKLAEALKGHRKLTTLDLQDNRIGGAGCQALAALLRDPECTLVDLDLHKNRIDNCGAKAVADALADNKKLEIACLDENCITADGWNAFIQTLCDSSSINATHESNHVLHTIASYGRVKVGDGSVHPVRRKVLDAHSRGDHDTVWLFALLALNSDFPGDDPERRMVHVARHKVLNTHFCEGFDMSPFTQGSMDGKLLPHVLSWVGRSCWAQWWCYIVGRSAVYELLRGRPMLCDMPRVARSLVEGAGPGSARSDGVAAGRRGTGGPTSRRSRLGTILTRGMAMSRPFMKARAVI